MCIGPNRLFRTITRFADVLRELEEAGIHVVLGDDFLEYRRHRAQQPDRSPVYPMFDVQSSYIDHTNGFWICGYDPGGDLIHTQAIRLLNLQGLSLAEHLTLHRHKYITPDSTPDPDKTSFTGPRALTAITGRVGYHGDFWLRSKGLAGPRSHGATAVLSRLLLEIAALTWNPSYMFALVPKSLAAKGAHLRYGYIHCEPGRWIGPDQQITDEDHLIWMSADDMAALIEETPPKVSARTPSVSTSDATTPEQDLSVVDAAVNA
ncbi:hypothetical protein [Tateyamaria sp. ANG-S1]|uniref:hypothetical protein n=1 Tax=Tateyamaria sp. ANG-S1 TaxID=1577905 RepID=UPI00068EE906|nr:hypothetical protein [Tateyamaria sp. ANG-S1]